MTFMKKNINLVFLFVFILCLRTNGQDKQQHNCSWIYTHPNVLKKEFCWLDSTCSLIRVDTSNSNNLWQIGEPHKTFFNQAFSQPNAIVTDTINNYSIGNHSYFEFTLPLIDNLGWSPFQMNLCISFQHKINTDSLKDGGYIEVNYHKDSAWRNIAYDTMHYFQGFFPMTFNCENLYSVNDKLFNGECGFSGTKSWAITQLQWIWMLPVKDFYFPDTIRLRFHFISDSIASAKDGWMIDNIEATAYYMDGNVEENVMKPDLIITPNPLIDNADVEITVAGIGSMTAELYDITGKKVIKIDDISGNRFQLSRRNLKNGMYYLMIRNQNQVIATAKVIFQ